MSVLSTHRLVGKTAVITGASSGIGAATAILFAKAGANVVLLARRTDVLETVADACRAAHVSANFANAQVVALAFDVGDKAQAAGLLARLPVGLPAPDILVNNAGLGLGSGPVGSFADHDVEKTFAVNIVGLIGLTQHFVRLFKERQSGHIINIGSIVGRDAHPTEAVYSATKFALHGFSDALRKELVSTPIRVTELQPGVTETEFFVARDGNRAVHDMVHTGFQAMTSEDVAEDVIWVAARPPHIQVAELMVVPTHQAGLVTHRT